MTRAELDRRARALPDEEQMELAYALLDHVVPALTPEQEREADRRIAAYRRSPSILVADDDARTDSASPRGSATAAQALCRDAATVAYPDG